MAAIIQHQKKITAFERFGIGECTGHKSASGKVYWNDIPIFIFCMRNIESPKNARNIDKQAPFRDVQSRTDPPSSAESEMISFKDVGMSGVLCCIQREIQKAGGNELYQQSVTGYIMRLRTFLLVVVQGPQIQHDYRVFRNKESFTPVVLNDVVILTQLVDRTTAKNFLQSVSQTTGNLDDSSNVRKVLLIFKMPDSSSHSQLQSWSHYIR